jgi:hypothetical protein
MKPSCLLDHKQSNAAIFAAQVDYIPQVSSHPRFRGSTTVQTVTNFEKMQKSHWFWLHTSYYAIIKQHTSDTPQHEKHKRAQKQGPASALKPNGLEKNDKSKRAHTQRWKFLLLRPLFRMARFFEGEISQELSCQAAAERITHARDLICVLLTRANA